MSGLMRKNLVLDDSKVKELARRRGLSESAAVREAVEHALAAEVAVDVFGKLQARGGVDDVFGKLPHAGGRSRKARTSPPESADGVAGAAS